MEHSQFAKPKLRQINLETMSNPKQNLTILANQINSH